MFYGTAGGDDLQKQYEAAGKGMYTDSQRDMMSFLWGEMAANNALERQEHFYNTYQSPEAQMRQLKEAGLSPSIFFAKGIAGGAGTSGVAGAPRSSANSDAAKLNAIFSAVGHAKEIALLGAQIKNINAQTKQTQAQTEEIKGNTQNQKTLTIAQAKELYARAGNENAAKALNDWQLNWNKMTEAIRFNEFMDNANKAYYDSITAQHNANITGYMEKVQEATWIDQINSIKAEYANKLKQGSLLAAQINLTDTQANTMCEEIAIKWRAQKMYEADAEKQREFIQAEIEDIAAKNGIELAKLDQQKREAWIDMGCRIFGSLCNVGCAALGADAISNNQTTEKTVSEMQYKNQDGTVNTVRKTKYSR